MQALRKPAVVHQHPAPDDPRRQSLLPFPIPAFSQMLLRFGGRGELKDLVGLGPPSNVSTPISPPSGPAQRLLQGPPVRSKFLRATDEREGPGYRKENRAKA